MRRCRRARRSRYTPTRRRICWAPTRSGRSSAASGRWMNSRTGASRAIDARRASRRSGTSHLRPSVTRISTPTAPGAPPLSTVRYGDRGFATTGSRIDTAAGRGSSHGGGRGLTKRRGVSRRFTHCRWARSVGLGRVRIGSVWPVYAWHLSFVNGAGWSASLRFAMSRWRGFRWGRASLVPAHALACLRPESTSRMLPASA